MDPFPPKRRARPTSLAPQTGHAPQPSPAAPGPQAADGGGRSGVSEFTQLALWMAATLAGVVTAVLLARRPFFESLARRAGGTPAGTRGGPGPRTPRHARRPATAPKPSPEQALPMLAEAIVGNSKSAVAAVFGPPRTAVVIDPASPAPTYWEADTWYYPLPRGGKLAVAIQFEDGHARGVQFLQAPRA